MIVKNKKEALKVECPNGGFTSYRYLLESDNIGFTMTKTVIPAGDTQFWHYKKHYEACMCVSGHGILVDINTGKKHFIEPDVMYALDKNDPHEFRAITDTVLICVFNPPLTGKEIHQEDGSYSSESK